jgi:hypothetical protein
MSGAGCMVLGTGFRNPTKDATRNKQHATSNTQQATSNEQQAIMN